MEHDHVRDLGELALATRLRRLSDRLLTAVDELYHELEVPFEGRWFGLVQVLAREKGLSVVQLAVRLGLSHTAVAQLLRELDEAGWTERHADPADARRNVVRLTRAGRHNLRRMEPVWEAVKGATGALLEAEAPTFLENLGSLETRLERQPLADQMLERLGRAPRRRLVVAPYRPAYRRLFVELNLAWLREHFQPDEEDRRQLEDPAGQILRRGGHILVALWQDRPVGVCALIRHGPGQFELAKMAVDPLHRRRGAGEALVKAACREARDRGADRIWLFTHPVLADALRLYQRLGFRPAGHDNRTHRRPSIRLERPLDPQEDLS